MKTRIEELLAHFEMSASRFADELGIQRSGMSHILSGRNKPSLELMQKVLARFPEVSTDWLISGKGDMLNTAPKPIPATIIVEKPIVAEQPLKIEEIKEPIEEEEIEESRVIAPEPIKQTIEPKIVAKMPIVQPLAEPQPEKVLLPREQLALFDVPAIESPINSTSVNKEPLYSAEKSENKVQQPVSQQTKSEPVPQLEIAKAIASTPTGKAIERIVVFYSDKTFAAYSPE